MRKLILGFVGEISSGKGTACDYLIKNHHAGYYRFSTIMRDLLDRLRLPQTRANIQNISTVLRAEFGQDLFAKAMAEDVKNDSRDLICVDGIRRLADIVYLNQIPGFHLIAITADERVRYERLTKRGQNTDDQNRSFEQFQKDQQQECELEIKDVVKTAEKIIDNSGDEKTLFEQMEKLLNEFQN